MIDSRNSKLPASPQAGKFQGLNGQIGILSASGGLFIGIYV